MELGLRYGLRLVLISHLRVILNLCDRHTYTKAR